MNEYNLHGYLWPNYSVPTIVPPKNPGFLIASIPLDIPVPSAQNPERLKIVQEKLAELIDKSSSFCKIETRSLNAYFRNVQNEEKRLVLLIASFLSIDGVESTIVFGFNLFDGSIFLEPLEKFVQSWVWVSGDRLSIESQLTINIKELDD